MIKHLLGKTFLVLTDKCLDLEADSHCQSATIGRAAFKNHHDLSFTSEWHTCWNLGRRSLFNVKPFESQEEKSEAESRRLQISKMTDELPEVRPVGRIYIYCGPCACAIQTARKITFSKDVSEYFDFAVRIDERIPTSCRRSSSAVDVLSGIRDAIDGHVVDWENRQSRSVGFIDCPQLEKSIYDLEHEKFRGFEPESVLQRILTNHNDESELPTKAIIIIAEADLCQLSLEAHPFVNETRKPRETDIFAFRENWDTWTGYDYLWQREYQGSYSRSKKAIEKRKAMSNQFTGLVPPPMSSLTSMAPPFPRSKRPRSESAAESDSQAM